MKSSTLSHAINFSKLPGLPLAGMAWPERRNPKPVDVQEFLLEKGIVQIFNLTGHSYDHPDWAKHFQLHDFPVLDFGLPKMAQVDAAWELVKDLGTEELALFHCAVGVGRTGTFLSCLIGGMMSVSAPEAILWLRSHRPGSVETPEQEAFIAKWLLRNR
jgi:atypical dual specificity phosphatase